MASMGEHLMPEEAPAPQDAAKPAALSVSAALAQAKTALESCVVTLVGEVSELSDKPGYKAVYFTVKDDRSSLPCMMWMNRYHASGVELSVGALVELTGRFTLYAAKGRMNFDVFSLRIAGEGNLRLIVANLARKLEAEGLMASERKRPIAKYPERIGLVTSPRGAAVHDVLRTLRRRYPLARVLLAGVPVEGREAPRLLAEGLNAVVRAGAEVVLLVRGGGSFEDLMPFNDEGLARAIAACPVPVVTGIGHEPDTSIADMVADRRASTPTAAAEAISSPTIDGLRQGFDNALRRLSHAVEARVASDRAFLDAIGTRPVLRDPNALLAQEAQSLDMLGERIQRAIPHNLQRDQGSLERHVDALLRIGPSICRAARGDVSTLALRLQRGGQTMLQQDERELALAAARLNDLSPLAILSRGYAIARDEKGHVVKKKAEVASGDTLIVRVSDGEIGCTVD